MTTADNITTATAATRPTDPTSPPDLESLLLTSFFDPLPAELLSPFVNSPPFVVVAGTFNFRTLSSPKIKPSYIFRSGTLRSLSPSAIPTIHSLGIKTIFDLRSSWERSSDPDVEIPGVESVWTEAEESTALQRWKETNGREGPGFYQEIARTHRAMIQRVLEHVRDRPTVPFLFHCTAGKDRTGVMAAILMALAGCEEEEIVREYRLTRIGIEPARDELVVKARAMVDKAGGEWNLENPIVRGMVDASGETMKVFLEFLRREWGGAEGWVKGVAGMSEGDLERIRAALKP